MTDLFGDKGSDVATTTAIAKRPKPSLVTIGEGKHERQVCSTGKFNAPVAADYVLARRDRWIQMGELSRVFYGANIPQGKKRVRKQMSTLFNYLLDHHATVLLYEPDGIRIGAVKVFDPRSEVDRQAAVARLGALSRRFSLTQERYALAKKCMEVADLLAAS